MRFAFSQRGVVPAVPCPMDGYGRRLAKGVHDPIGVRCLALADAGSVLYLCVLDVFFLEERLARRIREAVSKACGAPVGRVHVLAIHTHAGPKVSTLSDPGQKPDEGYLDLLCGAAADCAGECVSRLAQSGRARTYVGTCDLKGLFSNRDSVCGGCDTTGTVVRLESDAGVVDVLHVACHPTVLHGDNLLLSADYVGALRASYRELTGSEPLFLTGDAGDSSTRLTRCGEGFDEVGRIGTEMARRLAAVELRPADLSLGSMVDVPVALDYAPSEDPFLKESLPRLTAALESGVGINMGGLAACRQDLEQMLGVVRAKLAIPRIRSDASATVIDLGALRLALVPSEVVFELGRRLRDASAVPVLVCGYADGYLGYAVDEGAYGSYFESYVTLLPKGAADEWFARIANVLASSR